MNQGNKAKTTTSNLTLGSSSLRANDADSDNVPRTTTQGRAAEHWQPGKFNCNAQIQVVTDNRTYRHNINELLIHFSSKTFSWDRCWVQALLPSIQKAPPINSETNSPHYSKFSWIPLQQLCRQQFCLGFLRGGMQGRKEFLQKKRWLCAASDFRDSRDKARMRLQKVKT